MNNVKAHTGFKDIDIYSMQYRYDPTRTLTLRNRFVRGMRRRFRELTTAIRRAVVDQDVFALQIYQMEVPGRRQFDFPRSQQKVEAFMRWLRQQVDRGIIELGTGPQLGMGIEPAWTNVYVTDSYRRGLQRARSEMMKAGYKIPSIGEQGGIEAVMDQPLHADRVGVLYSRVFEELKGITSQMDSQITRILSQGMIDGDNPRVLARKMVAVINGGGAELGITDTLGRFIPARRRAEIMARTEIIRAHHQAMVQEYKNWRVEGVYVRAEWVTAGDDRVCTECAGMEGNRYSLEEIQNMIPRHPQCRCIALPVEAVK